MTGHLQTPVSMRQLFEQFSMVGPAEYATREYLSTAVFLVYAFAAGGVRAPAKLLLDRIKHSGAVLAQREVVARGHLCLAEAYHSNFLELDPYHALAYAEQSVAAFTQAEDLRNLCFAQRHVGIAQSRLGDSVAAEQTMLANMRLARHLQDSYHVLMANLFLEIVLTVTPGRLGEAELVAKQLMQDDQNNRPLVQGLAQCTCALSLLAQGRFREAEASARSANQTLVHGGMARAWALVILAQSLLGQHLPREARSAAQEAMQVVLAAGGGGIIDIIVRVAVAEVQQAAGDVVEARATVQRARELILDAADRIPDLKCASAS